MITGGLVLAGLVWRMWLAQATFFNTDEAWHFSLANQDSAWRAYKASLTISHPPLLILILHFWRLLGTSNLMLRLPSVVAGSIFCWLLYRWLDRVVGRAAAWAGLILASLLGPMIATSAEVRQNPLLLVFSMGAVCLLDRALSNDSVLSMVGSSACLYLAMLSHYSAFFVAAALGVYAIVRIWSERPPGPVVLTWGAGQVAGIGLAGFLYKTHLGKLNSLLDQALLPQQYLYRSYFHRGHDRLLPYLYRGTFGVFRFIFGQTQIGAIALLLFVAGVVLLFRSNESAAERARLRAVGMLLVLPFVLNWIAAAAGLYPYGRMRQCMFLAIFALAGVSFCLGKVVTQRPGPAVAMALGIVLLCHIFGSLQDRDALPFADQRQEHMDEFLQFIRTNVTPADLILSDKASSFQLKHYLCGQRPVSGEPFADNSEEFRCDGLKVLSTGPGDGALTAQSLAARWQAPGENVQAASRVWIVQGGWASGLGEALRSQSAEFSGIVPHAFGRYLEVFDMPPLRSSAPVPR